jgi:hypothetical protein
MFTKSGFHIEGFLAKLVLALLADYQLNPHPPQGNQIARISSIIWVFVPPSRNPVDEWLSSGGLARFQLGLPLLRDQSPLFGRSEKNRKSIVKSGRRGCCCCCWLLLGVWLPACLSVCPILHGLGEKKTRWAQGNALQNGTLKGSVKHRRK